MSAEAGMRRVQEDGATTGGRIRLGTVARAARTLAGAALATPTLVAALLAASALVAPSARAFEALDGRIQAHGFYEMQMRTLSADFSDDWDLSQWYHVFNLELEFDLIQETVGPLDLVSAYVRFEARYDCIYSDGCGVFSTTNLIDTYGNGSKNLPSRLNRGDEFTFSGQVPISNDGSFVNRDGDPLRIEEVPGFKGIYDSTTEGLGRVTNNDVQCPSAGFCIDATQNNKKYFSGKVPKQFEGADRNFRAVDANGNAIDDGTQGAPFLLVMRDFRDFRFLTLPVLGGAGSGHNAAILGPWLPRNFVTLNASMANQVNGMDNSRIVPQGLTPGAGSSAMRPIPIFREDDPEFSTIFVPSQNGLVVINPLAADVRDWNDRAAQPWEARGLFTPSEPLRRALREGKFGAYDFNINETDRSFNRGASQEDEGELKEAYVDIEMFDSRLWMRIGKQQIVWGKTELFRTTDQFNPQDFALASLASLEESRIALWSWRGIWSFYEVGPLSDVRVEGAFNFDEFESADLGGCGEPYTINLVCQLTFGSFAHGFTGIGVAGVVQPEDPWDSTKGWEVGGRIEWRWDRFSFALSDFYGYDDFPHPERLSTYNRNVDWRTGRPRYYMHTLEEMQLVSLGCATPSAKGLSFAQGVDKDGIMGDDFTVEPLGVDGYVDFRGNGLSGCLYPGPTNRDTRPKSPPGNSPLASLNLSWGVPYRVPITIGPDQGNNGQSNDLRDYAGQFWNNSSRADAGPDGDYNVTPTSGDQGGRAYYSTAQNPLSPGDPSYDPSWAPTSVNDWPQGPYGHLCDDDPAYQLSGGGLITECNGTRGRRQFTETTQKYIVHPQSGAVLLNPEYNPYYDPRFDRNFSVSLVNSAAGNRYLYFSNPGNLITTTPERYNPLLVAPTNTLTGRAWWGNAYDPTLFYDEHNALDFTPVNLTLFNFVCATTVGFSQLDPSACAQTVFGSTKAASDGNETRIAYAISAFLSGDRAFVGFVSQTAGDAELSKGASLPNGMGMPVVQLNGDYEINPDPASPTDLTVEPIRGTGLGSFRTKDLRRVWADSTAPWVYSREAESWNCLPQRPLRAVNGAHSLCGGLEINATAGQLDARYVGGANLGGTLSPEQEALLGCGPYFRSSCNGNGLDLLFAEGSALLQSFIGNDSIGIAFSDLGISQLVPAGYGSRLMDGGSNSVEYRTDGRVIGSNGRLIRIDPVTQLPALGSENGLLAVGSVASRPYTQGPPDPMNFNIPTQIPVAGGTTACDYSNVGSDAWLNNGAGWRPYRDTAVASAAVHNRWNSRCWDNRRYFVAYGIMPGTATFEALNLGGPLCTTPDIGGPEGDAGVLPGCRRKWRTILYEPLDTWDPATGLHPNNPDAGYIGNNFYGQVMSYKRPRFSAGAQLPTPRTDYRQYTNANGDDLATLGTNCTRSGGTAVGTVGVNPAEYDCFVQDPTRFTLSGRGPAASVRYNVNWAKYDTVCGDPNDLSCYSGSFEPVKTGCASGSASDWRCWVLPGIFDPEETGCAPNPDDPANLVNRDCWVLPVEAKASSASGLNWGTFNPTLASEIGQDCATGSFDAQAVDPDCYVGGWAQGVDGNPDQLSLYNLGSTIYPVYQSDYKATPTAYDRLDPISSFYAGGTGGWRALVEVATGHERVNVGCTSAQNFSLVQRTKDNRLIPAPECAHTYLAQQAQANGTRWPNVLSGGTGHPFTGESFASEIGGVSWNFMMLLVTFSDEFQDGLASVLGYVDFERFEQSYLYTEPGLINGTHPDFNPDNNPKFDFYPVPRGETNRLQRPLMTNGQRMPNILSEHPDLLIYECKLYSVAGYDLSNPSIGDCPAFNTFKDPACIGALFNDPDCPGGGYTARNAEVRFGRKGPLGQNRVGSLYRSMLWDYAFTGSENVLMHNIPVCEATEFSQIFIGLDTTNPDQYAQGGPLRIDCTRGASGEVLGVDRCTYVTPQNCEIVQALFSVAGQKRNILRAGGNGRFGRRTMQWQSGSEILLSYEKRNVLGFSMDFAEDYTKSNWSMEFTWIEGVPQQDSDSYEGFTRTNDFNLTVSVDRPTFINFLNPNRTLFINSQWFFQYREGYGDGFSANGPFNVLATLAVFTGYFQDRLNPTMVIVWDFQSSSGAALPQLNYRFNDAFSITIGALVFMGSQGLNDMPINPIAPASPRAGSNAYKDPTEPGLSLIRDRDEVFMSLRYTF